METERPQTQPLPGVFTLCFCMGGLGVLGAELRSNRAPHPRSPAGEKSPSFSHSLYTLFPMHIGFCLHHFTEIVLSKVRSCSSKSQRLPDGCFLYTRYSASLLNWILLVSAVLLKLSLSKLEFCDAMSDPFLLWTLSPFCVCPPSLCFLPSASISHPSTYSPRLISSGLMV